MCTRVFTCIHTYTRAAKDEITVSQKRHKVPRGSSCHHQQNQATEDLARDPHHTALMVSAIPEPGPLGVQLHFRLPPARTQLASPLSPFTCSLGIYPRRYTESQPMTQKGNERLISPLLWTKFCHPQSWKLGEGLSSMKSRGWETTLSVKPPSLWYFVSSLRCLTSPWDLS